MIDEIESFHDLPLRPVLARWALSPAGPLLRPILPLYRDPCHLFHHVLDRPCGPPNLSPVALVTNTSIHPITTFSLECLEALCGPTILSPFFPGSPCTPCALQQIHHPCPVGPELLEVQRLILQLHPESRPCSPCAPRWPTTDSPF